MKKEGAAWHPLFPLGRSASMKNVEVINAQQTQYRRNEKSLPFCMKKTIRILDAMSFLHLLYFCKR